MPRTKNILQRKKNEIYQWKFQSKPLGSPYFTIAISGIYLCDDIPLMR
ncbi:MAG: hypothetical protein LBT09_05815 [Planctomycetaceae bacterium]|nr:hypothetical protein [Planctomycetaceae bacterium]